MVHDLLVLGATVAGLTAARRLASEGFDVVVLDPNPEGASAAIGHGIAASAHGSTVATMAAAYGDEAAREHVRRNLAGLEEVRGVLATGAVDHSRLTLFDQSPGTALARELVPLAELLQSAGADVELVEPGTRSGGAALVTEAMVMDPADYAAALLQQVRNAGVRMHHDVTVARLWRGDGTSVAAYRDNLAWARELQTVSAIAVIDTLGISPWGRVAAMGPSQLVPVVAFEPPEPLDAVVLRAGPPVWLTRPTSDGAVAYGPKHTRATIDAAIADLQRWVEGSGGTVTGATSLVIDPSDHGRPVAGASAIPGGFYARGNGRGELMNGTASGCYLASVLLGYVAGAHEVALPWTSRWRAQARALRRRRR